MMTFLLGLVTGFLIVACWGVYYWRKKVIATQEEQKVLHNRLDAIGAEVEFIKRVPPRTETPETKTNFNTTTHRVFGKVQYEKEIPTQEETK